MSSEATPGEVERAMSRPGIKGIADGIADGLAKPGDGGEAAADSKGGSTPSAPDTKDPAPPRGEDGKFKSPQEVKEQRLKDMRLIVENAVKEKKALEAKVPEMERTIEDLKRQLHSTPAKEVKVDLDSVVDEMVRNKEIAENDAKHWKGPGRKILETVLKAQAPAIDPALMDEFKTFTEGQRRRQEIGRAFDSWRAEMLAQGHDEVADADVARSILQEWSAVGADHTPAAFNLAYRAVRSEVKVDDTQREAARGAAGATSPTDMGSGATLDSVRSDREALVKAGMAGDEDTQSAILFKRLGGEAAFFPTKE